MEKFHCKAINHNIRFETTDQSGVKILPCCMYKTQHTYQNLQQYYNSNEIKSLRSADAWPAGCSICKQNEEQEIGRAHV